MLSLVFKFGMKDLRNADTIRWTKELRNADTISFGIQALHWLASNGENVSLLNYNISYPVV